MNYRLIAWAGCAAAIAIASFGIWQNSLQPDAQQAVGYMFAVGYGVFGGVLFSAFVTCLAVILAKARSTIFRRGADGATELEWPLVLLALCGTVLIPIFVMYCVHRILEVSTANDRHAAPADLWKIEQSAISRHDDRLLIALAKNPAAPRELMLSLLASNNTMVKGALLRNPNIDSEILSHLAEDPDPHLRALVAASPKTPFDVLDKLSTDDSDSYVREIAQHWKQTRKKMEIR